jgi:hypothetical protein
MVFRGVRSRIELSTEDYTELARLTRQNMGDMSMQRQATHHLSP